MKNPARKTIRTRFARKDVGAEPDAIPIIVGMCKRTLNRVERVDRKCMVGLGQPVGQRRGDRRNASFGIVQGSSGWLCRKAEQARSRIADVQGQVVGRLFQFPLPLMAKANAELERRIIVAASYPSLGDASTA